MDIETELTVIGNHAVELNRLRAENEALRKELEHEKFRNDNLVKMNAKERSFNTEWATKWNNEATRADCAEEAAEALRKRVAELQENILVEEIETLRKDLHNSNAVRAENMVLRKRVAQLEDARYLNGLTLARAKQAEKRVAELEAELAVGREG